jgi:hypothetical protein
MYLFTRQGRLASSGMDGVEWASAVCAEATKLTGQPIQLWATVYSAAYGTIGWSAWFADLKSLEALGDALNADPGYTSLVAKGADHLEGGVDDALFQVLHGAPDPDRDIQYVSSASAVLATGGAIRGITTGMEIAQRAESITGLPTLFLQGMTGTYGNVGWLTGYEDITAVETASGALAADADWLTLIDSTAGCYVEDPASTQQTLHRRLG